MFLNHNNKTVTSGLSSEKVFVYPNPDSPRMLPVGGFYPHQVSVASAFNHGRANLFIVSRVPI